MFNIHISEKKLMVMATPTETMNMLLTWEPLL